MKVDNDGSWYLFQIKEDSQESNNAEKDARKTRKQIRMFPP
jgi:hypothetical protein